MENVMHQALQVVDAHVGPAPIPPAVRRHAAAIVAERLSARLNPPLAPELSWSLDLVAAAALRRREVGGAWQAALAVAHPDPSAASRH